MKRMALVSIIAILSACGREPEQKQVVDPTPPANLVYPKYSVSAEFTGAVYNVMTPYFWVARDFASDEFSPDTKKEMKALLFFAEKATGRDMSSWQSEEMKNEWRSAVGKLWRAVSGFPDNKTIAEARIQFADISDALIALVKLFGHQNEKPVQVIYCPMAKRLNGKGAYWIQENANDRVRNPYHGREMLECGEKKELLAAKCRS